MVSVIITVYNGERYLDDAIKSVLNQKEVQANLIVVNDGSTDNTESILGKYKNESNITVIGSKRVGRSKALNLGLSHSKDKYVAILDADDLYHPYKLKSQLEIMEADENITVLSTDCKLINDTFELDDLQGVTYNLGYYDMTELNDKLGLYNPVCHSSVIIRKSILEELNGYNEDLDKNVDYDLWVRIAKRNGKIFKLNAQLTYKRLHANQNFERKNRLRYLFSSIRVQRRAIKELRLSPLLYAVCFVRLFYGMVPRSMRTRVHAHMKGVTKRER